MQLLAFLARFAGLSPPLASKMWFIEWLYLLTFDSRTVMSVTSELESINIDGGQTSRSLPLSGHSSLSVHCRLDTSSLELMRKGWCIDREELMWMRRHYRQNLSIWCGLRLDDLKRPIKCIDRSDLWVEIRRNHTYGLIWDVSVVDYTLKSALGSGIISWSPFRLLASVYDRLALR